MKTTITFLIITFIIAACGSSKIVNSKAPESPNDDLVQIGQQHYPDLTLAQLNNGKSIYESQCNACHALKSYDSQDKSGWENIVPKMVQKTNKKAGNMVINDEDQNQLLRYLVTMSESMLTEE